MATLCISLFSLKEREAVIYMIHGRRTLSPSMYNLIKAVSPEYRYPE